MNIYLDQNHISSLFRAYKAVEKGENFVGVYHKLEQLIKDGKIREGEKKNSGDGSKDRIQNHQGGHF